MAHSKRIFLYINAFLSILILTSVIFWSKSEPLDNIKLKAFYYEIMLCAINLIVSVVYCLINNRSIKVALSIFMCIFIAIILIMLPVIVLNKDMPPKEYCVLEIRTIQERLEVYYQNKHIYPEKIDTLISTGD